MSSRASSTRLPLARRYRAPSPSTRASSLTERTRSFLCVMSAAFRVGLPPPRAPRRGKCEASPGRARSPPDTPSPSADPLSSQIVPSRSACAAGIRQGRKTRDSVRLARAPQDAAKLRRQDPICRWRPRSSWPRSSARSPDGDGDGEKDPSGFSRIPIARCAGWRCGQSGLPPTGPFTQRPGCGVLLAASMPSRPSRVRQSRWSRLLETGDPRAPWSFSPGGRPAEGLTSLVTPTPGSGPGGLPAASGTFDSSHPPWSCGINNSRS